MRLLIKILFIFATKYSRAVLMRKYYSGKPKQSKTSKRSPTFPRGFSILTNCSKSIRSYQTYATTFGTGKCSIEQRNEYYYLFGYFFLYSFLSLYSSCYLFFLFVLFFPFVYILILWTRNIDSIYLVNNGEINELNCLNYEVKNVKDVEVLKKYKSTIKHTKGYLKRSYQTLKYYVVNVIENITESKKRLEKKINFQKEILNIYYISIQHLKEIVIKEAGKRCPVSLIKLIYKV